MASLPSIDELIGSSVLSASTLAKKLESESKNILDNIENKIGDVYNDGKDKVNNVLPSMSDSEDEGKENGASSTKQGSGEPDLELDAFFLLKLQYPTEIQSLDDQGGVIKHWVTFYISEVQGSKYFTESKGGFVDSDTQASMDAENTRALYSTSSAAADSIVDSAKQIATNQSKQAVDAALGTNGAQNQSPTETIARGAASLVFDTIDTMSRVGQGIQKFISKRPQTKMLRKTINIYMPDTVMTSQNHNYTDTSLTQMMGLFGATWQAGGGLLQTVRNSFEEGQSLSKIATSLQESPGGAELLGRIGEALGAEGLSGALLRKQGYALNPQVELFFNGTNRREFQLDFRFNSRSENETRQIQEIIKAFRMHSAPSIPNISGGSTNAYGARYFALPSQFNIKFMFRDNGIAIENPNIAKIGTCVLERVDVNYVGNGKFMTFEDGQPIDIEVRLAFREIDIVSREDIEKGL